MLHEYFGQNQGWNLGDGAKEPGWSQGWGQDGARMEAGWSKGWILIFHPNLARLFGAHAAE